MWLIETEDLGCLAVLNLSLPLTSSTLCLHLFLPSARLLFFRSLLSPSSFLTAKYFSQCPSHYLQRSRQNVTCPLPLKRDGWEHRRNICLILDIRLVILHRNFHAKYFDFISRHPIPSPLLQSFAFKAVTYQLEWIMITESLDHLSGTDTRNPQTVFATFYFSVSKADK